MFADFIGIPDSRSQQVPMHGVPLPLLRPRPDVDSTMDLQPEALEVYETTVGPGDLLVRPRFVAHGEKLFVESEDDQRRLAAIVNAQRVVNNRLLSGSEAMVVWETRGRWRLRRLPVKTLAEASILPYERITTNDVATVMPWPLVVRVTGTQAIRNFAQQIQSGEWRWWSNWGRACEVQGAHPPESAIAQHYPQSLLGVLQSLLSHRDWWPLLVARPAIEFETPPQGTACALVTTRRAGLPTGLLEEFRERSRPPEWRPQVRTIECAPASDAAEFTRAGAVWTSQVDFRCGSGPWRELESAWLRIRDSVDCESIVLESHREAQYRVLQREWRADVIRGQHVLTVGTFAFPTAVLSWLLLSPAGATVRRRSASRVRATYRELAEQM